MEKLYRPSRARKEKEVSRKDAETQRRKEERSHAKTQRRKEEKKNLFYLCVFASLREILLCVFASLRELLSSSLRLRAFA